MKKAVLAIVMLLAIIAFGISPLRAQSMTVGAKGGLNVAKLTLSGLSFKEVGWKYGGVGGIFLCFHANDIFALQFETLFSMKGGSKFSMKGKDGRKIQGEETQSANYIEIPLLAKLCIPIGIKMIKPYVFAGPALGILLSSKAETDRADSLRTYSSLDTKDWTKRTDFGIAAGAGVEYKMSSGCLLLEARYERGLINIWEENGIYRTYGGYGTLPEAKNNTISIMVGYGFTFSVESFGWGF